MLSGSGVLCRVRLVLDVVRRRLLLLAESGGAGDWMRATWSDTLLRPLSDEAAGPADRPTSPYRDRLSVGSGVKCLLFWGSGVMSYGPGSRSLGVLVRGLSRSSPFDRGDRRSFGLVLETASSALWRLRDGVVGQLGSGLRGGACLDVFSCSRRCTPLSRSSGSTKLLRRTEGATSPMKPLSRSGWGVSGACSSRLRAAG